MSYNFIEKEEESNVYVVLINEEPRLYTTNMENARSEMKKLLSLYKHSPLYRNSYFREKNENEIDVYGFNKYSIINVDQLIHTGKIIPIEDSTSSDEELSDFYMEKEKKGIFTFW